MKKATMTHVPAVLVLILACILNAAGSEPALKDFAFDGMSFTVKGQTLSITPLKIESRKFDAELKPGEAGWRGPVFTPGTSLRYAVMTKGSLKVFMDGELLREGVDYSIDYDWGTLGAPKGSKASGKKVSMEYTYTSSRLDLVVSDGKGVFRVIEGKPDSRTPLLPEVPEGATPRFSVYLPHNTVDLGKTNINIIDNNAVRRGTVSGSEHVRGRFEKLRSGEPFTMVFLGDSITAQTEKGKTAFSFVEKTREWIKQTYPDRVVKYHKISRNKKCEPVSPETNGIGIVMAGVGGDDSARGLARLDMHVLVHKPDIVFIMFGVNDENKRGNSNMTPPDAFEKNIVSIIERIRQAGGEPVLMTQSWKNLGWSSTFGNLNQYAERCRIVAEKHRVCLIDHYKAWEDLPKTGYNYMIYLSSCINHPNEMGHELFFEGVKALLSE